MLNKILFFGNERLGTGVVTTAPTLQALIQAGYQITGVIVAQNELGQSRRARELEIAQVARQHTIPVLSPAKLIDMQPELAALGAEIGVLVAYGKIVPQSIIDIFPRGIINIHPSLLPLHRGPTPIESVILEAAQQTGVSLMHVTAAMDSGPVYAQTSVALSGDETKQNLADQLLNLGKDMLLEHLPAILEARLQPAAQDDNRATYDKRLSKLASQLDWHKPAAQLEREIRAYAGWPRSRTTLAGAQVIITRAHAAEGNGTAGSLKLDNKQLGVQCDPGILIIDNLIPAGKKEMSASGFLAGYQLG